MSAKLTQDLKLRSFRVFVKSVLSARRAENILMSAKTQRNNANAQRASVT